MLRAIVYHTSGLCKIRIASMKELEQHKMSSADSRVCVIVSNKVEVKHHVGVLEYYVSVSARSSKMPST